MLIVKKEPKHEKRHQNVKYWNRFRFLLTIVVGMIKTYVGVIV